MDARKDRLIELLLLHAFQDRPDRPYQASGGQPSPYHLDGKAVALTTEGQTLIGGLGYECAKRLGVTVVGGTSVAADPFARAVATHSLTRSRHVSAFVVRPGGAIEGVPAAGTRVLVVDDVSMTGASLQTAVDRAREAGLVVEDALVAVDREEGAREALRVHGVELHALVTLPEILARRDVARAHGGETGPAV
jgi:orotate phosphoribosyltransferase